MAPEARDDVVVTAVADDDGLEHVLSRFGDSVWDLSPEIEAKNVPARGKKIAWPEDLPPALVSDAKAALYCAMRQGKRGVPIVGRTAKTQGHAGLATLRYLADLGVTDFSQVKALYLTDHIAELRKSLSVSTVANRLSIIDLVWSFPNDVMHPLAEHPFAGRALHEAVGGREEEGWLAGRAGKTPVIPPSVQSTLWSHCETVLSGAEELLASRDAGKIEPSSWKLNAIRDAALYVLQVTSGMRNSESTGVRNACWREEERTIHPGRKVRFHWLTTKELKTTGGEEVDFLVPPEAFSVLALLQRYAEPLQRRLADEARWLEELLRRGADESGALSNGMGVADAVQRLNHVRSIANHMMLTVSHTASDHLGLGSKVEVMSNGACNSALKKLARDAGTDWNIANHQCRRTFAYNVANSRLGRMGLVFIKWQFKHKSISWTQLYAANPRQDQALYEEFSQAIRDSKAEVIAAWHEADSRLSGGAGKKVMETRATTAKDLTQLLTATAQAVNLRSTGHAWCMSGTDGCHGQGVYDPSMCGGCSQAVIDESQAPRWQMIHLDNLRLAAITDCGPAVVQKANRAVQMSTQVLADLRVPLPTAEMARAFEEGRWVE